MSRARSTACVLLFARQPVEEETAKRIPRARHLFEYAHRRIAQAVGRLAGVELLVAGPGPGAVRQRGPSFGEKLLNAFRDARALGFDRIVAVPIDTPQIDERHLREALLHLETGDVVLGRSPDGGVYLIGARGDVAPLFQGVRWRSGTAGSDLLANAPGAVTLREELADVDGLADLKALSSHAALDPELDSILDRLLSAPEFHRPRNEAQREAGAVCRLPIPRAPPLTPPTL